MTDSPGQLSARSTWVEISLVFAGGLARLLGLVLAGVPPAPMLGGLTMELVVTPLLCVWQGRVAAQASGAASRRGRPLSEGGARA